MPDGVVTFMAWLTPILGAGSLAYAGIWRKYWQQDHPCFATFNEWLVGLWVILPPVWFWWEWYLSRSAPGSPAWERMAHGHEVSRNIWLALVVVLAAMLKLQWPGG